MSSAKNTNAPQAAKKTQSRVRRSSDDSDSSLSSSSSLVPTVNVVSPTLVTPTPTVVTLPSQTVSPSPSPSVQPERSTSDPSATEEIMRKMMQMMMERDIKYEAERKDRENRYEAERKEREMSAARERAELMQILKDAKEREMQHVNENARIKQELEEAKRQQEVRISQEHVTPLRTSTSTTHSFKFLTPEVDQKLRTLAFTLKNLKSEDKGRVVNVEEEERKLEKHPSLYDEEEEKVRRRERQRDEKVIYENEDAGETHLQSYVKWLEQRERLYPYEKQSRQLYRKRYTLLSAWGRYCEWLRTGFYLSFPISLYGVTINRWYLYKLQECKLAPSTGLRKVSDRVLSIPAMSYDDRDVRVNVSNEEMEDLLPNSHILRTLPLPLRCTPDINELERYEITSLQEYTKYKLHQKARRQVLIRPNSDPSSGSSSSSENDLESYDCGICGCVVHDRPYSDVCEKCELKRKIERKKAKLEAKVMHTAAETAEIPKLEKVEKNYNHEQEMFAKIRNLVREERQGNIQNTNTPVPSKTSNESRDSNMSENVLGRVLNELFTPSARRTLEMTKLPKPTSMTEIAKSAAQLVTDLGKFDGDVSNAPRWIHEYCRGVYRYSFDVPNCIYIITKCFIGEAKAWVDQILDKVSLLHESSDTATRPIEALLLQFKQQYMGQTQISMWKRQLVGTKLTSTAATTADLKSHYKTFVTIINNLRLCDKYISEEEYRIMYMDSLPYSVSLYIGRDYQKFTTLDEIFQIATEAITKQNMREKRPADGSLAARKETINSFYLDEENDILFQTIETRHTEDASRAQWRKLNSHRMVCFHCGQNGHTAFECPLLSQPQTTLGAAAWAKRNVMLGKSASYDVTKYQQNNSAASTNQPPPSIGDAPRKRLFKKGQKPGSKYRKKDSKNEKRDAEVVSDDE
jgi:hypothetical protein